MTINFAWVEELCAGDPEFEQRFYQQLVDSCRRSEAALQNGYGQADWREVQRAAHELAGMLNTLGAPRLGELCAQLEEHASTGQEMGPLLGQILQQLSLNRELVQRRLQRAA